MSNLFWVIITALVVLWLAGQLLSFGGPLIHSVLAIVAVLVVFNLMVNRRPLP